MMKFFEFESDFAESLRCIPMQIRFRLDTCGVKLKLSQWNQLSQSDRRYLVELPCETEAEIQAYRQKLQELILQQTGEKPGDLAIAALPAWLDVAEIPESVQEKALEQSGKEISLEQWNLLVPLQRFALIKLSRSQHENRNFLPALNEFKII
jgi:hypothetical protein